MNIEEKNAIIEKVSIEINRGMLSAWLFLKYDGGGQGFGGYVLYKSKGVGGFPAAGHFIWRVFEIVGVDNWDRIEGKTIRVRASHDKVHAIGHIIKNEWFYPEEEFKKLRKDYGCEL